MNYAFSKLRAALHRPRRPGQGWQVRSSYTSEPSWVPRGVGVACALMLAHSPAFAADRATCGMAVKLLEAIDGGVEAAAAGDARTATSGIALFAKQTQDMADRHSQNDPLPGDVAAALSAILAETATQYFIAVAAPVLLEQALVIQQAMPDICAASEIPDLSRHDK